MAKYTKEDIPNLDKDTLFKVAKNTANRMIGSKLGGLGWDDLSDINSLWDYISEGMSGDEFIEGVKSAVEDRIAEEGMDDLFSENNNLREGRIFFDYLLQGSDATEEGAYEVARGLDWQDVETHEASYPDLSYVNTVNGVGIYYQHGSDSYYFTDESGSLSENKKVVQITQSQLHQIIKEGVAKLHKRTLLENEKKTLQEELGKIVKGISGPQVDIDGITDTLVRYYTELPDLKSADEKVYTLSKNTLFGHSATPEVRKEFYLNLSDKIMKLANSIDDELMMGFPKGTKNQLISYSKGYNSIANTGINNSMNESEEGDWTTVTMNSSEVDDFIDYLDGWNLQYDAPIDLGNGSVSIHHEKETEDVMNTMNHQDVGERLSNMDDASNYSMDEGSESEVASPKVMEILNSYLEAALWTEEDEVGPSNIESDISDDAKIDAYKDVMNFMSQAGGLIDGMEPSQIGHDLWLTRNGHGAGFWDRGLGDVGVKLTDISQNMGSKNLYVGDDGKIYID